MTNRLLGWAAAAAVVAALVVMVTPVGADQITANVPFSFTVNGKSLPAGTYVLTNDQSILWVRGGGAAAVVLGSPVESRKDEQPKLVFHRYGDRYILREAWMGTRSGRKLAPSALERELAASAARERRTASFERVEIPLL
jgi:hypothetical protein